MADDDDIFADLLGPKPAPDAADAAPPPMRPKQAHTSENGVSMNGASPHAAEPSPRGDLLQQGMYVMLKEDARDYIHEAVRSCVDDAVKVSVGKVVQGLRDVLVSVTKRMEKVETEVGSLKDAVASADMESVTLQLNTRFTSVDESLRDLARAVQAMRDRAELVDTQSQLSKMQLDGKKKKKPVKAPSVYDDDSTDDEHIALQRSPPARAQPQPQPEAQPAHAPQQQQPASIQTVAPPPPQQQQMQQQPLPTAPPATPMQPYTSGPFQQSQPQYAQPPPAPPLPSAPDPYQSQPRHQYSSSMSGQPPPPPGPPPSYQASYSQPQSSYSQPQQTGYSQPSGGASYPAYSAPTAPSGGGYGYPAATAPSGPGGYSMGRGYSDSADYGPKYGRSSPGPPARQQEQTTARSTQQVVSDICQIGFERRRVESVLAEMLQSGKEIDLNAVVDRLMSESR